jgi:hypothetical protein
MIRHAKPMARGEAINMDPIYKVDELKLSDDDSYGSIQPSINALAKLPHADTPEQAHQLYWKIDNNLLIQGSLYGGAVKSLQFLMASVFAATNVARPYILELIFQIMNGHIAGVPDQKNEEYKKWSTKNALGLSYYLVHLMLSGAEDEQDHAEDILSLILIEYPDYEEVLQGIKEFATINSRQEQAFSRILNEKKKTTVSRNFSFLGHVR